MLEELLRKIDYNVVEDLLHRMKLNYDEIIDILGLKYVPTKRIGYSLKPNIYQISDINNTLKNSLPDNVELSVTIEEKIYTSNLEYK